MLENIRLRLEIVTNVSLLLATGLVCFIVIRDYLPKPIAVGNSGRQLPAATSIHSPLELPGIQLSASDRTLVFVLSSQCHFCRESSEFYRRLMALEKPSERLQFVALVPPDDVDGPAYLKTAGLTFQKVGRLDPNALGVRGTPTLILVDRRGNVLKSWSGKLPLREEGKVLDALQ